MGLVGAAGQEVAEVVHQSGRRQLVVTGMEMGQQRPRLQRMVELRDRDAGAEHDAGPGRQNGENLVDVEVRHRRAHRFHLVHAAILPPLQVP